MKKKTTLPLLQLTALVLLLLLTSSFVNPPLTFPQNAPLVDFSPFPQKVGASLRPQVSAESALVFDPVSAVVLFEKNPDVPLPPASTTKMITALVVLDRLPLSQVLEIDSLDVEPQVMKLEKGERLRVRDLLYGVLVWSANDASEVLSQAFPGGRGAFIEEMNKKAKELGMTKTNFTNPSGLPEENHYSTARDLSRFAAHGMKNQEFASMVGTPEITVWGVDGKIPHKLVNLNELLGRVPGVLGVKTGFLDDTGGALVTYVERDARPIVVVVLNSWDRFGDSEKLIEWTYASFEWEDWQLAKQATEKNSTRH